MAGARGVADQRDRMRIERTRHPTDATVARGGAQGNAKRPLAVMRGALDRIDDFGRRTGLG